MPLQQGTHEVGPEPTEPHDRAIPGQRLTIVIDVAGSAVIRVVIIVSSTERVEASPPLSLPPSPSQMVEEAAEAEAFLLQGPSAALP